MASLAARVAETLAGTVLVGRAMVETLGVGVKLAAVAVAEASAVDRDALVTDVILAVSGGVAAGPAYGMLAQLLAVARGRRRYERGFTDEPLAPIGAITTLHAAED
jgi:hypothetical protein